MPLAVRNSKIYLKETLDSNPRMEKEEEELREERERERDGFTVGKK